MTALSRLTAAVGVAAWLLLAAPAVAHADVSLGAGDGDSCAVDVSVDGVHWSRHASRPLFDGSAPWVPGQQETRWFWVRNPGATRALLAVSLLPRTGQGSVGSTQDVQVQARTVDGAFSAQWGATDDLLVGDPVLPAGATRLVQVRVRVRPRTTAPGADSLDVGLGVALRSLADQPPCTRTVPTEKAGSRLRMATGGVAVATMAMVLVGGTRQWRSDG